MPQVSAARERRAQSKQQPHPPAGRVSKSDFPSQPVVLFSFGFSESPGSCFLCVFKLVSHLPW